jgi:hypothetical protein
MSTNIQNTIQLTHSGNNPLAGQAVFTTGYMRVDDLDKFIDSTKSCSRSFPCPHKWFSSIITVCMILFSSVSIYNDSSDFRFNWSNIGINALIIIGCITTLIILLCKEWCITCIKCIKYDSNKTIGLNDQIKFEYYNI